MKHSSFSETCKNFSIECSSTLVIVWQGEGEKVWMRELPSLEGAGAGARECAWRRGGEKMAKIKV